MSTRLHCIWTGRALHLWGEDLDAARSRTTGAPDPSDAARFHPSAMSAMQLRTAIGEVGDALLVADLPESSLVMRLPTRLDRVLSSEISVDPDDPTPIRLERWHVASLPLGPADAIEWLARLPSESHSPLLATDSVRFWSRVAAIVLEQLAGQRFVPDLVRRGMDAFEGEWRVTDTDAGFASRLATLVAAMPPVCRSFVRSNDIDPHPLDLVESFVHLTVDGLARRFVQDDEIAAAVLDQLNESPGPEARWLATLVSPQRRLSGAREEGEDIHARVRGWLARLDQDTTSHRFRVLLRLHAPGDAEESRGAVGDAWRLTFHLQSLDAPELVIDAADVAQVASHARGFLRRPIEDLPARLREDLHRAARHFEPLSAALERDLEQDLNLTLAEAYHFLRHAMPLLTLEGLAVEAPPWWGRRRAQLGLRMRLRPTDKSSAGAHHLGFDSLVTFDWQLAIGDESVSSEELRRLAQSGQPLARVGDRWVEVNASAIAKALEFMDRPGVEQTTLLEAMRRALVAEPDTDAPPVVEIAAEGWIGDLLASTGTSRYALLDPPRGFHGTLRPYQLRGLSWLDFLDRYGLGGCLADDMGLGKTIQLIALLVHERQAPDAQSGPTLIIVPMSVVGNWQRELSRFAPDLRVMIHHGLERLSGDAFVEEVARHDVIISTYGLVNRDLDHLRRVGWWRIAIDEAQNIKNPGAKQSVALRALRCPRRVALTGTPVENRLGELWSIMDFLNPGLLGSAGEFRRIFATPVERRQDGDAAERLRRLIRPFVLRRRKRDPEVDVDLPDKLEMSVYCNLTHEQASLYEQLTQEMLTRIDAAGGIQRKGLILTTILKLKQVCNHPAQFLGDSEAAPQRSGKCNRLVEMMEEALSEGDRALVFTQFRQMGELLKTMLEGVLEKEILFLHGGTSEPKRRQIVDDFQSFNDARPILILSLKAGGVGLNLTAANHVFHFDRWWNPAVEDQATDRAHRIGQSRKVQVHKFVCVGTLEERIEAMLQHKKDIAERIIGGGEEWLTELSTERLRELFTLSREAVSD